MVREKPRCRAILFVLTYVVQALLFLDIVQLHVFSVVFAVVAVLNQVGVVYAKRQVAYEAFSTLANSQTGWIWSQPTLQLGLPLRVEKPTFRC